MLILSIDTSSPEGSVALLEEGKPVVVRSGETGETYSSRLFRWLEELKGLLENGFDALGGVAVAVGPGSFTGLRIGVATAKGISLATGCRIIPFPTLEAMALAAGEGPDVLCPLLAAGRGEVYTAVYRRAGDRLETLVADRVAKPEGLDLSEFRAPIFLFGNGLDLCRRHLEKLGAEGWLMRDRQPLLAPAMAQAALMKLRAGEGLLPRQLRMNYIRLSDAERRARDATSGRG